MKSINGVKSETTVNGLKELDELVLTLAKESQGDNDDENKSNNVKPYFEKRCYCHVVPQLPFTKEKDEEIQKYTVSPQSIQAGKEWEKKHEKIMKNKKQIMENYMIDKNGAVTANNINWDLVSAHRSELTQEVKFFLANFPKEAGIDTNTRMQRMKKLIHGRNLIKYVVLLFARSIVIHLVSV